LSSFNAQKSQKHKKTDGLTVFFALLGSLLVKAACKMLKSTPDEREREIKREISNLDAEWDHPDSAFVASFPTFRFLICLAQIRRIPVTNCLTTNGPRPRRRRRRRRRSRPRNRGRRFPD